jgi:drug/metabolite transporter (DMT)-like permease
VNVAREARLAHRRGLVFLAAVVLAWGLTWPVNKVILESLSPLWAVALRTVIGCLASFAIAFAAGRLVLPPRADLPVLLGIALLHMVGFGILGIVGLGLIPTGHAAVLAYTTPLWVTPGASLFLGERLTARKTAGVIVGLAGLVVLFNPTALDWSRREAVLGSLAMLGAAFLWAASIVQIRGHRWSATPFALVPWETLVASLVLVPVACAFAGPPPTEWNVRVAGLLLYAAVPGTALAYWATAVASRDLPAVTTSLGLLATPVVSMVVAAAWLGEPLTLSLVVAMLLILGGVALGATGDR